MTTKSVKSMKCDECHKKIGILDEITCKCRCGNVYCTMHRLDHGCLYDYAGDFKMKNNLVKLEEKKLDKI